MIAKFDKVIVWATMGGIWLLVVTLCNKDITTNGPIGSAIAITAGFAAAYFSKPMIAKFARYQIILIVVLMWSLTIYLLAH